jgi:hypothetical protein
VYTRGQEKSSPWNSEAIAAATRVVVEAWSR